ncbi:MAG: ABC transporter permease [Phycisphaerales bacterium]|nr:ABC transporter permease [Phycisphaerales bacterium]
MSRIWAIARHTLAEGLRLKIAHVFLAFIAVVVVGLPVTLKGESAISDAVQTYLSFSSRSLGVILSLLTIFLSRSLSDEFVNRQMLVLMTKPIQRWQYVVGKWLGMVTLNTILLFMSGVGVYVGATILAGMKPRDEADAGKLKNELLTARHATSFVPPDFSQLAAQAYQERLETGAYAEVAAIVPSEERTRIAKEFESQWRTVPVMETRLFEFTEVRCRRSPDKTLQIRYKAEVYHFAPDEILRCEWIVGNPDKGTPVYYLPRRDVIQRYQTMSVPTDAVAPDRTLTVALTNRNPFEGERQEYNTVSFLSNDDVQVLFEVGSFAGNLVRQLALTWCRLSFLAALAVLLACVFSFPVACLIGLTFLAMTSMAAFVTDALIFFDEDVGVPGLFQSVVQVLYKVVYFIIPDFSRYNGADLLVDGRNVTLRWVLEGVARLVLCGTTFLLLIACLLFQRREVAEVSV